MTMLSRRFFTTSAIPWGAVEASTASNPVSGMVTLKAKLVNTETMAAHSVLTRYRMMTVRNFSMFPPLEFASDDATSMNTRIGAMAFKAPTNSSPSIPIHDACGTRKPRIAPMTRQIRIRRMRFMEFHFRMIRMEIFPFYFEIVSLFIFAVIG